MKLHAPKAWLPARYFPFILWPLPGLPAGRDPAFKEGLYGILNGGGFNPDCRFNRQFNGESGSIRVDAASGKKKGALGGSYETISRKIGG